MLSNRPYLARAFYQWIVDSHCTPVLVMDANNSRCIYPEGYDENGEVVLNISPVAIRDLKISNESIEFSASFSGMSWNIYAPMSAIIAIYAEENGEGIFFDMSDNVDDGDISHDQPRILRSIDGSAASTATDMNENLNTSKPKSRPILTVVE